MSAVWDAPRSSSAQVKVRAGMSPAPLNDGRGADAVQGSLFTRPARSGRERLEVLADAQLRVSVQASCSAETALALMQDRAELTDRTLYDIADAVNQHTLWFSQ